ncbi:MAG: M23 family metallopeptidase [Thermoleophilia bacterium]|nr:M23 family metallopeptidase [Thermoleophilia bacterium]
MRRVLLACAVAALVWASPAEAWSWPVEGPVLRPFSLGENVYAGGHHRGVDIAAPAGSLVRAPVAGEVSFAGTVPQGGKTVTLRTADGWSVTLVHLGSFGVRRGERLAEREVVGTIGPSGEAEHAQPYVHLGVRRTAEEHGYVDPLSLLPERAAWSPSLEPRAADVPASPPASVSSPPAGASPPSGTPAATAPPVGEPPAAAAPAAVRPEPTASQVAAPEPSAAAANPADSRATSAERHRLAARDAARSAARSTPASPDARGAKSRAPIVPSRGMSVRPDPSTAVRARPAPPRAPLPTARDARGAVAGEARDGSARRIQRPLRHAASRAGPLAASPALGREPPARAVHERGEPPRPAAAAVWALTAIVALAAVVAAGAAGLRGRRKAALARPQPLSTGPCPVARRPSRGRPCGRLHARPLGRPSARTRPPARVYG